MNKERSKVLAEFNGVLTKPSDYSKDSYKISKEIDTTSDETISVIVEFVSELLAVTTKKNTKALNEAEDKDNRDHRVFENFLSKMPKIYSLGRLNIKQSYSIVYNGVALDIKASEVENLLNCGAVKRIHKNYEATLDSKIETTVERVGIETKEIKPYMMDSVPYLDIDDLNDEGTTGAGRVNPYEAVHEKVSFKATYNTVAGMNRDEIENTTSMLSYGKVYEVENGETEKIIPVTVTNNPEPLKKYNVSVEYSNSERATDANNVSLDVVDSVIVSPGESKTFDAKITLPLGANMEFMKVIFILLR